MNIGARIKTIRGNLSRDKFAPIMCISKTTLVNYETGLRTPDADFLNKILSEFPDISPAWLLSGEGPMLKGSQDPVTDDIKRPYYAKKFREIRGDKTIEEFCKEIGQLSQTWWEYEENFRDPSWFQLNILCHKLGINPAWLLEDEGPMMKADICCNKINVELLRDVIKEAEIHDSINPGALSSEKKAELIAELYAVRAAKGK